MPDTTAAVLGTGTMGAPIARNLLSAGLDVRVWNRTRAKAEPLAEDGATVCGTPAEAVRGAGFVLTTLADADTVVEILEEDDALGAMEDDAVWIQVATVGVESADGLAELAAEHAVDYVDAPVLGTRAPAERGELVVLASGPEQLRTRCDRVFDAIGQKTVWLGPAGRGSRMKMVTNLWLLAVTVGAAEAIALAEGLGLDPRDFLETMRDTAIDTPYLHLKGEAILERSLEPSFRLELAAKDARLVLDAARSAGAEVRAAAAVHEAFERAVELGHGDEDMAAVYFAAAPERARTS
jgi:3-hydroxyisobutyrate dehydrogenase